MMEGVETLRTQQVWGGKASKHIAMLSASMTTFRIAHERLQDFSERLYIGSA
jgi:hypothetical protein